MNNLLLIALRKKYRFQTSKGALNSEQLFELGKQGLHDLYLSLESKIQKSKGLLGRKGNTPIEHKLEIVKQVFNFVVEEEKDNLKIAENKRLQQVVLEAADKKEVKEIVKGKSAKELRKLAKKLEVKN